MASISSGIIFYANGNDQDCKLYQGKSVSFTVTWGGDTPIDITGFKFRMYAKATINSTDFVFKFDSDGGSTGTAVSNGGATGIFTCTMTHAASAAITDETFIFDAEVEEASGHVHQAFSGKGKLIKEVTA
jgi:hypothetical protein